MGAPVEHMHLDLIPPEGIELPAECPGWGNPDYNLVNDADENICLVLCDHMLPCNRAREKAVSQQKSRVVIPTSEQTLVAKEEPNQFEEQIRLLKLWRSQGHTDEHIVPFFAAKFEMKQKDVIQFMNDNPREN